MRRSSTSKLPADGGYPVDADLHRMTDDGGPPAPDPARWADPYWRDNPRLWDTFADEVLLGFRTVCRPKDDLDLCWRDNLGVWDTFDDEDDYAQNQVRWADTGLEVGLRDGTFSDPDFRPPDEDTDPDSKAVHRDGTDLILALRRAGKHTEPEIGLCVGTVSDPDFRPTVEDTKPDAKAVHRDGTDPILALRRAGKRTEPEVGLCVGTFSDPDFRPIDDNAPSLRLALASAQGRSES